MFSLNMRLWMLVILLFAIIYAAVTVFMQAMGVGSFYFYVVFAVAIVGLQYQFGPKIVELMMRVRYVNREEEPWLCDTVEELARAARLPVPRVGIAETAVPNAFAFGRGRSDGRVCVTRGIIGLLDRAELRAVLGHEMAHLKNRDVVFITVLSVLPLILYRIFIHFLFFGGGSRRREGGGHTALIGFAALVLYFITNLLVLYASRIREYFADRGSLELGNTPAAMASALYKLVRGAARVPREKLREVEGAKAFFLNNVAHARQELAELSQLDADNSGTIDEYDLAKLKQARLRLGFGGALAESMSTHPNILKRIKHLAEQMPG